MALRLEGQELAVTATHQDVNIPESLRHYTLVNDGTASIFFRQKDDGKTFEGTPSELKALFGCEIKAGNGILLDPPVTRFELVCATGLTATTRLMPGRLVTQYNTTVNADVDIGSVNLLNKADEEIDPATEGLQIERYADIDEMNDASSWTKDGTGVTATPADDATAFVPHEDITKSIKFSKSSANGDGFLAKTIDSLDLSAWGGAFVLEASVKHADYADMTYFYIRMGTDASNYHEWRTLTAELTAAIWQPLNWGPSEAYQTGTGCDMSAITYLAVGVEMDGTQALADINVGEIRIYSAPHTTTVLTAEITSEVSTPNINMQKVGNKKVTIGAGAVGTGADGTQRMTLASDDPAVVAVQNADYVLSATYKMTVAGTDTLVNLAGALPTACMRIAIRPEDSAVQSVRYAIGGAATASTPEIPAAGMIFPVTKTVGDTIQLFAASSTPVTLEVFIPRN